MRGADDAFSNSCVLFSSSQSKDQRPPSERSERLSLLAKSIPSSSSDRRSFPLSEQWKLVVNLLSGSGFTSQLRVILKRVFIPSTPLETNTHKHTNSARRMKEHFVVRHISAGMGEKGDLIFSNQIFMTFGAKAVHWHWSLRGFVRSDRRPLMAVGLRSSHSPRARIKRLS